MKKLMISLDNINYCKNLMINEAYVTFCFKCQKEYMNEFLKVDGVVLVKDVLSAFGIPITHFTTQDLLCGWFAPITKRNTPDKRYRVKMKLKKYKVNDETKYMLILEARHYG